MRAMPTAWPPAHVVTRSREAIEGRGPYYRIISTKPKPAIPYCPTHNALASLLSLLASAGGRCLPVGAPPPAATSTASHRRLRAHALPQAASASQRRPARRPARCSAGLPPPPPVAPPCASDTYMSSSGNATIPLVSRPHYGLLSEARRRAPARRARGSRQPRTVSPPPAARCASAAPRSCQPAATDVQRA